MNRIQGKLTYIRKVLGLNQQEFAKMLGVSNTTVCLWEYGKLGMKLSRQKQILDLCKRNGIEI